MTDAPTNPTPLARGGLTLGIEMSNPSASDPGDEPAHSVALWGGGGALIDSAPMPEGARGSDGVMRCIGELARANDSEPAAIGRVLVSVGPGGYTALRIATTSAKVLADTLRAQLIPVPSARVASIGLSDDQRPALIALASKKGRSHASVLGIGGALRELGVIEPAALADLGLRTLVADRHLPDGFASEAVRLGVATVPLRLDARDLMDASEGIEPVDPLRLAPIYAREPDAVTQWRARGSG